MVEHFDHEGLHQLQNCFVADEDLHGRNVLPLTSLLREVFKYLERKFLCTVYHRMSLCTILCLPSSDFCTKPWHNSHQPLARSLLGSLITVEANSILFAPKPIYLSWQMEVASMHAVTVSVDVWDVVLFCDVHRHTPIRLAGYMSPVEYDLSALIECFWNTISINKPLHHCPEIH